MKTANSIAKGLNYFIVIGFVVSLGYIVFLYFNPKIEQVYIQAKPTIKIVFVERSDSTKVAKTTIPQSDLAEEMIGLEKTKEMYERLIPEIKDYKREVAMLTEIRSNLEGKLTEKDILIQNLNKQPATDGKQPDTTWKGEYMTITHDSGAKSVAYQYNSVLQLAMTKKKDSVSIFASSPDKNNKINGMDTYVQKFNIPKRFSEIVMDVSLGKMNLNKDFTGLVGNGRLKWKFNPDGKFRPYIFIGATTDFEGVYYPAGIGTEYKIK